MTLNYLPPLVCQWCGHRTLTVGDTVVCRTCDRPEEAPVSWEQQNRQIWKVMAISAGVAGLLTALILTLHVLVWP